MATLYMTIGLPYAGKDYVVNQMLEENPDIIHVSSDNLREELFGDVNDQKHNSEIFEVLRKRVREALLNGRDVIVNATNLSKKKRRNFLKTMPSVRKIALLMATDLDEIKRRMELRERKVPLEVIKRMLESFQPPAYEEGFHEIKIIRFSSTIIPTEEHFLERNLIPHDNFHHKLDVAEHMIATQEAIVKLAKGADCDYHRIHLLAIAARYHDIGKYLTKSFVTKDGKPYADGQAHYYNHTNVSAYLFLVGSRMISEKDRIHIANLIYYHMDLFAENYSVDKPFFSTEFKEDLLFLHKADIMSA